MWNKISTNVLVGVYTFRGVCYLGHVVENNWVEMVLEDVEVYDHEELYKTDVVCIPKEDIELVLPVRAMELNDRLM